MSCMISTSPSPIVQWDFLVSIAIYHVLRRMEHQIVRENASAIRRNGQVMIVPKRCWKIGNWCPNRCWVWDTPSCHSTYSPCSYAGFGCTIIAARRKSNSYNQVRQKKSQQHRLRECRRMFPPRKTSFALQFLWNEIGKKCLQLNPFTCLLPPISSLSMSSLAWMFDILPDYCCIRTTGRFGLR